MQDIYLNAVIALIKAKADHTAALAALVKHRGGRTPQLCEDIVTCMRVAYPNTDACVGVYARQPIVSFPNKGSGYQFYKDNIAPHLPKLRKPTGGKRGSTDPVEAEIKRLLKKYSAAQRRRIRAGI